MKLAMRWEVVCKAAHAAALVYVEHAVQSTCADDAGTQPGQERLLQPAYWRGLCWQLFCAPALILCILQLRF